MTISRPASIETVSLSQARSLIECMAEVQSVLLMSPLGTWKSATVVQAATSGLLHLNFRVVGFARILPTRGILANPTTDQPQFLAVPDH